MNHFLILLDETTDMHKLMVKLEFTYVTESEEKPSTMESVCKKMLTTAKEKWPSIVAYSVFKC